jgi:putative transposase
MTETLVGVNPPSLKDPADPPSPEELAAAKELVRQARAQGVALTGPGGLLKALTKTVIETALEEELAEHLGYDKHDPVGRNRGNSPSSSPGRCGAPGCAEHCAQRPTP